MRIVVVFNGHWWPTAGATARSDQNTLKWLGALALLDRVATWRGHPVMGAVHRHLVEAALGRWVDYQAIAWAAYALKDHDLLKPVPELVSKSKGPAKFAKFAVVVDSVRLTDFRAKMTRREARLGKREMVRS
jgi:hypothetical protein